MAAAADDAKESTPSVRCSLDCILHCATSAQCPNINGPAQLFGVFARLPHRHRRCSRRQRRLSCRTQSGHGARSHRPSRRGGHQNRDRCNGAGQRPADPALTKSECGHGKDDGCWASQRGNRLRRGLCRAVATLERPGWRLSADNYPVTAFTSTTERAATRKLVPVSTIRCCTPAPGSPSAPVCSVSISTVHWSATSRSGKLNSMGS